TRSCKRGRSRLNRWGSAVILPVPVQHRLGGAEFTVTLEVCCEGDRDGRVEAEVSRAPGPQPPARARVDVSQRPDRDVCDRLDARFPPGEGGGEGLSERSAGAAGRRGIRLAERVRRPGAYADRGAAGEEWSALQPVPHHGPVLADAGGVADRSQSS